MEIGEAVCSASASKIERIAREDDSGWPCARKGHDSVNARDGSGSVSRGTQTGRLASLCFVGPYGPGKSAGVG
jgi:hypothetical protein